MLSLNGRLFDAQGWLGGEPLSGVTVGDEPMPNVVQPLRPEILACLAGGLAEFHLSASSLRPMHADESAPLSRRLAVREKEITAPGGALIASIRAQATGSDRHAGARWLELVPKAIALAEAMLEEHPVGAHSVSVLCHGDLWASHAYFDRAAFVGLTDFESLRFGSPAFDLAQLILHFNGWASRDTVLEAYEKVAPLEGEAKAVLTTAAVVDLAFEGEWALDALYGGKGYLSAARREAYGINVGRCSIRWSGSSRIWKEAFRNVAGGASRGAADFGTLYNSRRVRPSGWG